MSAPKAIDMPAQIEAAARRRHLRVAERGQDAAAGAAETFWAPPGVANSAAVGDQGAPAGAGAR